MDFAKKQLEKYGWAEGEGLGKHGNGRAHPIRVKIKRDYGGVGLEPGEEAVGQWWNRAFDTAVRNITVVADEEEILIRRKPADSSEDLLGAVNRRYRHTLMYREFVKPSAPSESSSPDFLPAARHKSTTMVSDLDLWKACSGRTAHKAARHGMRLSGKLKRIEEQEAKHSVTVDDDQVTVDDDQVTKDDAHLNKGDVCVAKCGAHVIRDEGNCAIEHDASVTKDSQNRVSLHGVVGRARDALQCVTEGPEDTQHHVTTGRRCHVTDEDKNYERSVSIETQERRKHKRHKNAMQ